RLDNEMQVVALNSEVHEAEAVAFASGADRLEDEAEAGAASKASRLIADPHRDVHRVPSRNRRSANVRYTCARLLRSTCSLPVSTAPGVLHLERQLPLPFH